MVEHWREAPGVRGSTPLLGTMIICVVAGLVFASVVYSIIRDVPAARFNLSCQGIYGKYLDKKQNNKKCVTCRERFQCWTTRVSGEVGES